MRRGQDTRCTRPLTPHPNPSVSPVLTTKVWQRATALFVEGLAGSPPGRLSGKLKKLTSPSKVVALLEESCREEVGGGRGGEGRGGMLAWSLCSTGSTIEGARSYVCKCFLVR